MASNPTYVFMDLGTTKISDNTRITELSLVAVRRDRLLDEVHSLTPGAPPTPRLQLKLTLCFNPGQPLGYTAKPGGGFTPNDLLSDALRPFDESCFFLIDGFLNILTEPVYLIAHNGFKFDFPILKRHLNELGKSFTRDVLCADTYYGFYDILESKNAAVDALAEVVANVRLDSEQPANDADIRQANAERVKKHFPWGAKENKPKQSYQLSDVHDRVLGQSPEDAHKCDIDCQLMLRIAVALRDGFPGWVERNHSSFAEHVASDCCGVKHQVGEPGTSMPEVKDD